jgi:hypothetical protein
MAIFAATSWEQLYDLHYTTTTAAPSHQHCYSYLTALSELLPELDQRPPTSVAAAGISGSSSSSSRVSSSSNVGGASAGAELDSGWEALRAAGKVVSWNQLTALRVSAAELHSTQQLTAGDNQVPQACSPQGPSHKQEYTVFAIANPLLCSYLIVSTWLLWNLLHQAFIRDLVKCVESHLRSFNARQLVDLLQVGVGVGLQISEGLGLRVQHMTTAGRPAGGSEVDLGQMETLWVAGGSAPPDTPQAACL